MADKRWEASLRRPIFIELTLVSSRNGFGKVRLISEYRKSVSETPVAIIMAELDFLAGIAAESRFREVQKTHNTFRYINLLRDAKTDAILSKTIIRTLMAIKA